MYSVPTDWPPVPTPLVTRLRRDGELVPEHRPTASRSPGSPSADVPPPTPTRFLDKGVLSILTEAHDLISDSTLNGASLPCYGASKKYHLPCLKPSESRSLRMGLWQLDFKKAPQLILRNPSGGKRLRRGEGIQACLLRTYAM